MFHTYVQAAPAADLFRTKVHEGQGTSEKDPYERTLPNMRSVAPTSTVLHATATKAPSLEELEHLDKYWYSLQVWLNETYPRLPLFVEQQKVPDALPVSPNAEALLVELVEKVIPSLSSDPSEVSQLQQWWVSAETTYAQCGTQFVLDRKRFTAGLHKAHSELKAAVEQSSAKSQLAIAMEVLHRKAILEHNRLVDEYYYTVTHPFVSLHQLTANRIWQQFLESVATYKGQIFTKTEDAPLLYAWEALMAEEEIRPPNMTAPVALFFALTTLQLQQAAAAKAKQANGEGGRGSTPLGTARQKESPQDRYVRLLSVTSRRKYVMEEMKRVFSDAEATRLFSRQWQEEGEYELARDLALCAAMQDSTALLRTEAESVVEPFENITEVKSLFASIYGGEDTVARQHLHDTLQIGKTSSSRASTIHWDHVLSRVNWKAHWKELATILLMNPKFLSCAHTYIQNAIGAKGVERRLFHSNYAKSLDLIKQAREERETSRKQKMASLMHQLSSYEMVDKSVRLLLRGGASSDVLESEANAVEREKQQETRLDVPVTAAALAATLHAVQLRHPSWVKSGVLPSDTVATSMSTFMESPVEALRLLTRMFIRIAYVPQAGSAAIAKHTRRRIGPIGLSPTQFNIPAEFGMVEQYDNLQYKRYDWQGWYQRMVDIHNRNVSIRCRLDDLKRLDVNGMPFVDLQTERRLRIICGNRVGMSILKLDSDKYEDQDDNITYGTTKLSEILAESRKAQLGLEYWPTVEVKVRKPSGQSQAHYSVIDNERIEKKSAELYEKYKEAKRRSLFVTPMDLWLEVKGAQGHKKADVPDADGYSMASLHASLDDAND